jgi:SAM-dependent methyltransferase
MPAFPDYVANNQSHWNRQAGDWVEAGERNWAGEPNWGMWGIPESQLGLLPEDMTGMDAIELGCGTAYVSAWMTRRGASVVGVDVSEEQLVTARRLADEHGLDLDLIHGNAEEVPCPDESFDFAISEYGAAIWADPYKWIPEAWRLLRPGGELVFLGHHPFVITHDDFGDGQPAGWKLVNPYFGMHRMDWEDDGNLGTEFSLPISEWFRLFRDTGFDVIDYLELRALVPSDEVRFFVRADWAHDYPSEQVWKVRKRQ